MRWKPNKIEVIMLVWIALVYILYYLQYITLYLRYVK